MLEDKNITKFAYGILVLASIIIDGPLVPILSMALAIGVLVYKLKAAKNNPADSMDFMLDILILGVVIVVNIVLAFLRFGVIYSVSKHSSRTASSSYETFTVEDFATSAISSFKTKLMTGEIDNGYTSIKNGFKAHLEEAGVENVVLKNNKVTCTVGTDTIVFTIKQDGNITYKIK